MVMGFVGTFEQDRGLMPHSEMTKQKLKLFGCGSLTASLFKDTIFRSRKKASSAETIPNLIWAPSFLVPEKFGPQEI